MRCRASGEMPGREVTQGEWPEVGEESEDAAVEVSQHLDPPVARVLNSSRLFHEVRVS